MDLRRLRFGDWVMGVGGLALLAVMFVEWFEPAIEHPSGGFFIYWDGGGDGQLNAWQSFAVNDVLLAIAAGLAIAAFVLTALQPTAAVPLALASLATLFSVLGLVLVTLRIVWPPDIGTGDSFETARMAGAWLGLVATALLTGGCLASIRDQRLPRPQHPVEPRLVSP